MAPEVKKEESWDNILPIPKMSKRFSMFLVLILSAGCYIISVDGDFVFDDSEAIINNKDVTLKKPISDIFLNDFWGTRMTHNESHKSYRPVTILTFRFNFWLNNGVFSSFQYRIFNIILHSLVCLFSIEIFELLMGGGCYKAATLCAVIFSTHPIHCEVVAGVVGRAEILCALFYFISFILYHKAAVSNSNLRNMSFTLLSIFFVVLAMFSKEQGITVLGICLIYDLLIVNRNNFIKYLSILKIFINEKCNQMNYSIEPKIECTKIRLKYNNGSKIIIYLLTLRFTIMILAGLLLLYLRWAVMDGVPPTFKQMDNPASFIELFFLRIVNYSYIYAINCWLMLCPVWLCFDWSMGCVPLIENFRDIRLLFVIFFWFSFSVIFIYSFLFGINNRTNRSVTVALVFSIISFLPASNLFFKVGFVVAERVLYLPSVGYCVLISIGLRQLMINLTIKPFYKKVIGALFWILVVLLYASRSVLRSNDWRNEYSLFSSALEVCPLNAKVHYNMGKVTLNKTIALNYYKEALRLYPDYTQAMNNLAIILKDIGKYDEAEELLKKLIKLRPNFAAAWMNIGIVYSNKKNYKNAEDAFFQAIKYRKHYPDCYYNLGNLYLNQKYYDDAAISWRKATSQKPTQGNAWNNLIIMLDSIGKYQEAESVAMEALSYLPTDPGIHFNLANTLGKLSRFEEAEKHFKIAITFKEQPIHYINLGVLYHRWKKYKEAKEMYKKALLLNPNLESAKKNLDMLPLTR